MGGRGRGRRRWGERGMWVVGEGEGARWGCRGAGVRVRFAMTGGGPTPYVAPPTVLSPTLALT